MENVNAFLAIEAIPKLPVQRVGSNYITGWTKTIEGYSFSPDYATPPPIVTGCLTNNDCPDYTACQSRKCINPCAQQNVCAPNANCIVTRHKAVCTCPDGFIGSPEVSCLPRKLIFSI